MTHVAKGLESRPNTGHFFDGVGIGKADRDAAEAYMQKAEFLADLACQTISGFRSLIADLQHGYAMLARRTRKTFWKLVHH